jgi:putative ABC transport system permease protein
MFTDYILLALKNVRNRGVRSWLTMLGIFLGIAAVVSLISLGTSLQTAITGQFATLDPNKLIIENSGTGFGPPGSTSVKKLTSEDLELIKSVNGVEFAIPRHIRVGTTKLNKISRFEGLSSLPQDSEEIEIVYDSINAEIDQGKLLESTDRGKVVLGSDFLEKSRYQKQIGIGTTLEIQGKTFQVSGILDKSGFIFINSIILMSESDLKDLLNIEDEIDVIVVQVEDSERIESVASDIERTLRKDRKLKVGEEDFSVQTPVQSISTISTILNVINLVVTGIAGLALLIGGIGIANTMFTSVLERTREIGIMKAIGARNKDILSIFLIESAFLGLIGGIVGAAIGLGLAFGASTAATQALGGAIELKVSPSIPLLLVSISFSLLIGILSGIVPAYQASRLNPVEALRK